MADRNHKFANDEICTTPHLTDQEIQGYYLSALRKLLADKDEIIAAFEQARDAAFDLSALTAEGNELQNELFVVSELMHQSMYENARVAQDQVKYNKYYTGLTERYQYYECLTKGVWPLWGSAFIFRQKSPMCTKNRTTFMDVSATSL